MRVKTGPAKTPDGYYLIVVEGSGEELDSAEKIAIEKGLEMERSGNILFVKTRSRRLQMMVYKELVQMSRKR